ncbi:MAG: DUF4845 domain-containing protein [Betaproteobacteria bacterium]|nr:DUF4845 domain-containing protein [Betaproteobacteria bacterium]
MNKQEGISLSGLVVTLIVLALVTLLGLKLLPSYLQYFSIQSQFRAIANDPEMKNATPGEVRKAFSRRAQVENITAIEPGDVEVTKDGNQIVLSASYSVRVPLVANISACLDFTPTGR